MNWKRYIFGALHAAAVGAGTAVFAIWASPQQIAGNWKMVGSVAAWGAASSFYLYLKEPPRTEWTDEQRAAENAKRQQGS